MLRMLATLLEPTAGDATVGGESVRRNPQAVRRVLGYMPDAFGVYDDMKVWEYLDFFGRCYGLGPAKRRRMIGDLLELVDLAAKRDAYVLTLSRGMQQRLCLAHALVHDPKVLILDEPASGLDPRARVELRELLRELRAMGKTILISSHILPELEELCTSVAIIDRGRVLDSGRISEISQRLRAGEAIHVRLIGDGAAGPARVRGGAGLPAPAGRHRVDDPAHRRGPGNRHARLLRLRRRRDVRLGFGGAGHLHRAAHAPDPDRGGPCPGIHRGNDQWRARATDARPLDGHADLLDRDRPRQAAQRAGLDLRPHPDVVADHRARVRLRRRSAGRSHPWLPDPVRDRPRARIGGALLLGPDPADGRRDRADLRGDARARARLGLRVCLLFVDRPGLAR